MKNIFIYTENYEPGGGNQYVIDLINSLPAYCTVILASNRGGIFSHDLKKIKRDYTYNPLLVISWTVIEDRLKLLAGNGFILFLFKVIKVIFRYLPLWIFKNINQRALLKIIKHCKPDLIISCNGGYPGGLSCLDCVYCASYLKIPVWLSVISTPQKKSLIDILYMRLPEKMDKLIVNADSIAKDFIERRRLPESQIVVLHSCLPANSIMNEPSCLAKYQLTLANYKLGYIGRIEQAKGVFYLLESFQKLLLLFPNLQLIMVGSGRDLEKAKLFCKEVNIEEKVKFLGFRDDITTIFKTLDLFVFPSLWEGFPYAVLEAMANSKLVISTNVGGVPEMITDGYNGFLVPPGNADALYIKIKSILENSINCQVFVNNALKTIQTNFSEDKFKNKVTQLLESSFNLT